MRAVILTTEQGNQIALCNKLASHCELAGIVLSKNIPRRKKRLTEKLTGFARRASVRVFGREFIEAWSQMQQRYLQLYPKSPEVPTIHVNNINDEATTRLLQEEQPDLVIVSGTNLVNGKTMESAPAKTRFINLHTGISPFVKGGPNCSNWCLAEKSFHLIGNTVMWLDLGIDSGNIITTEQTQLDGRESLFELHWKVMEHAHDLYGRVIDALDRGQELPSVPQESIGAGRTFYGAEWNGLAARKALKNFRQHYAKFFQKQSTENTKQVGLKLIPLEGRISQGH